MYHSVERLSLQAKQINKNWNFILDDLDQISIQAKCLVSEIYKGVIAFQHNKERNKGDNKVRLKELNCEFIEGKKKN